MIGNLGIGEIVLIAGIALVALGPEKFPEFAKVALRAFRDLRGYLDEAKREISEELRPVKKEIEELSRHNPEDYIESLAGSVTDVDDDDGEEAFDAPPGGAETPYAEGDYGAGETAEDGNAETPCADGDNGAGETAEDGNAEAQDPEDASELPERLDG